MVKKSKKSDVLILIVDDDQDIRESLKDMLDDEDYTTILAKDAAEAIRLVNEKKPDIIFIDMMLPVLIGNDVYTEVKKIKPDIVGVIMTGYREEMKELIKLTLDNGAYTCLYKPRDLVKVVKVVDEIVDKFQLIGRKE